MIKYIKASEVKKEALRTVHDLAYVKRPCVCFMQKKKIRVLSPRLWTFSLHQLVIGMRVQPHAPSTELHTHNRKQTHRAVLRRQFLQSVLYACTLYPTLACDQR